MSKKRQESASGYYHLTQRGVIKMNLFHQKEDYEYYLSNVRQLKDRINIKIYHYCLMTNHVHQAIKAESLSHLTEYASYLACIYARYYRRKYKRDGQVFQRNYGSKPILDDAYLFACGRYIERNPVEAGIAATPDSYPWSSYPFYAGMKEDGWGIITLSPLFEAAGQNPALYSDFVTNSFHPTVKVPQAREAEAV